MSQKHNRIKLNRYTASILALLVVAPGAAIAMARHTRADAAQPTKPAMGAAVPSQFTFIGATSWWQGATRPTDMALFHRSPDGCFTSVQHHTGSVDVTAELQKLAASQAGNGGTSTAGAVTPLNLQTNAGAQSYDLHQYSLTPGDGNKIMEGLELGYLQLRDSYVKIEGHCNTPDQLPATIPALQAITFDATK